MLRRLLSVIHQERRRLLFAIVLAYVSALLAHAHLEVRIDGYPIEIFIASLQAVVVGVFALLVCIFLPSMRFMIEAIAVSRLALASFMYIFPGTGILIQQNPMFSTTVVVIGAIGTSRLIHGRMFKGGAKVRFRRFPARLESLPWQKRFVHWVDDTRPIAVRVTD